LAGASALCLSSASADTVQLIRIRADAPTRITGITPQGGITWTSSVPDLDFTIETAPGDAKKWGAMVSGKQTGFQHSMALDLLSHAQNLISVKVFYSILPLPRYEMRLLESDSWTEVARAITDDNGECFFYNMPPANYLVGNYEFPLYAEAWWDSPIILGVKQTNEFTIHMMRKVPALSPGGDLLAPSPFNWGTITDCVYYDFRLYDYTEVPGGGPALGLVDERLDLLETTYSTPHLFVKGHSYRWYVTGFDLWNNPVMRGEETLDAKFDGAGGGGGNQRAVFGLVRFSTQAMKDFPMTLRDGAFGVVYRAKSDDRGWYTFTSVAPGTYWLNHEHSGYSLDSFLVTTPDEAGYQATLQLTKWSTSSSPSHETVKTDRPTFRWTGIPKSSSYSFRLYSTPKYDQI